MRFSANERSLATVNLPVYRNPFGTEMILEKLSKREFEPLA